MGVSRKRNQHYTSVFNYTGMNLVVPVESLVERPGEDRWRQFHALSLNWTSEIPVPRLFNCLTFSAERPIG